MSDNPMQDEQPITRKELDQLLLSLAYQDLAEGEDINDHPAELARQKIKKLQARIAELEALLDIFKRGHIVFNRKITDAEAEKAYAAMRDYRTVNAALQEGEKG